MNFPVDAGDFLTGSYGRANGGNAGSNPAGVTTTPGTSRFRGFCFACKLSSHRLLGGLNPATIRVCGMPHTGSMRKLSAAVGCLALAFAVAGCSGPADTATSQGPATTAPAPVASSAAPSLTANESKFDAMWTALQPNDTPEVAKQMSETVCLGFGAGVDMATQEQTIMVARSVDLPTATLMINTIVNYTCPEHTDKMIPKS